MVEFALVIIPLMLLLLGAVQFGVIWATQIGVTNAVRDSVRAASLVQPKASGDPNGTVTNDNTGGGPGTGSEEAFANSINASQLSKAMVDNIPFYDPSHIQVQTVCYSTFEDVDLVARLRVTVTVKYGHPIFIPLLAGILGNSIATTTSLSLPVGLDKPYVLPPVTDGPPLGCSS